MSDSGAANGLFVRPWLQSLRSIDHKLHAVAFDEIDHVRAAFFYLIDAVYLQPGLLQAIRSAVGGNDLESQFYKATRKLDHVPLIAIIHADEDRSGCR